MILPVIGVIIAVVGLMALFIMVNDLKPRDPDSPMGIHQRVMKREADRLRVMMTNDRKSRR